MRTPEQILELAKQKSRGMYESVVRARNSPVTFHNQNIGWLVRVLGVTWEEARVCLGYSKPIATYTAAEYRKMSFRGGGMR
jgi:hypothetical protein